MAAAFKARIAILRDQVVHSVIEPFLIWKGQKRPTVCYMLTVLISAEGMNLLNEVCFVLFVEICDLIQDVSFSEGEQPNSCRGNALPSCIKARIERDLGAYDSHLILLSCRTNDILRL